MDSCADSFFAQWNNVCDWNFEDGNADVSWFEGAKLNVSENCLDKHINEGHGSKPAVTWEFDDGTSQTFSYAEVLEQVSRMGNVLRDQGVSKGDRVTIVMPMIPQLMFSLLACARIGAVHSVIFAGFSADAVADRIVNCDSDVVLTADAGVRGGKAVPLKDTVDKAIDLVHEQGGTVRKCLVTHRAGEGTGLGTPGWQEGRDVDLDAAMQAASTECSPEEMDAEDPLFILYTSGSTGKPKGVLHTQAGYMVYAGETFKYVFDYRPDEDVHFCTADIGWVTGHTYLTYGPMLKRAHQVAFEGVPTYPHPGRLWEICEKHKVSHFYTAPTALRALMVHGDEPVKKHDLSSLKLLGTVGEPINPEAWLWYHRVVGREQCPVVDTLWMSEAGGVMIAPLPGCTPTKPGSACLPFFGVKPEILHTDGEVAETDEAGFLTYAQPWPGMMRTVYGDHDRFKEVYFSTFPSKPGSFNTGDGARIDKDGYLWAMGRTDDVINVSGHRLGTAEVESALVLNENVVEAAVVGVPHPIKGEGIYCFTTLKNGSNPSEELQAELVRLVREQIGPIAKPDAIHFTQVLPKTRSGKIMRRILRKVAAGDAGDLGDTTTLADPSVVEQLLSSRVEVRQ